MNIGRILIPATLALITTWSLQYFFLSKYTPSQDQPLSGQTFVAPINSREIKPLKKEIDFIDDLQKKAITTVIDTDAAYYEFSTAGASLQKFAYKKQTQGEPIVMQALSAQSDLERETSCFLVALADKTPYWYELVGQEETDHTIKLMYAAKTDNVSILKNYTLYKNKFLIDLDLTVVSKTDALQDIRIFYPAPYMVETASNAVSGVFNNEKGSLVKKERSALNEHDGWFSPQFFGSEDRFFLNVLVGDENHFVDRAYYKLEGQHGLISILEGPAMNHGGHWNLSFYVGPKEEIPLAAVDPKLESLLDYSGILAPLSKLLIKILNFFYRYVKNYGWAIILLTLLINIIFLPFRIRSTKGMKKMQDVQKKLAYIEQKYKHDPERLRSEKAELIAKHGLPGIGGCLPLLAQLPIFFALSRVLTNSLELYKAPFLWVRDLSAPDPLYILPFTIAASMIFQGLMSGEGRQQFTALAMALVFGAFSARFSAGLCLYIIIGTLFFAIQTFIQEKMKRA